MVGNFLSASVKTRFVCEELAKRLSAANWSVITTSCKHPRLLRLADIVHTAWSRRHDYKVAQLDVYSGAAFVWAEAAAHVFRHLGKPFVATLHGGNLPLFSQRWPRRVGRLLRAAASVTTPSPYLQHELEWLCTDMKLIPNAVDLSRYSPRVRAEIAPNLLWLRAFHRIYNPNLAADALALIVPEFPDACLTIVGPDKHDGSRESFVAAVAGHGLTTRVKIVGAVANDAVPIWLNKADIFVNTTTIDNTPVSVLEAMASGMCIVSTAAGGIPYLLRDGDDALLVPPDDPGAMASAVCTLLVDKGLPPRLSREAIAAAKAHDWSVVLPAWEALFHAVSN